MRIQLSQARTCACTSTAARRVLSVVRACAVCPMLAICSHRASPLVVTAPPLASPCWCGYDATAKYPLRFHHTSITSIMCIMLHITSITRGHHTSVTPHTSVCAIYALWNRVQDGKSVTSFDRNMAGNPQGKGVPWGALAATKTAMGKLALVTSMWTAAGRRQVGGR
jgi:hypothetical protein